MYIPPPPHLHLQNLPVPCPPQIPRAAPIETQKDQHYNLHPILARSVMECSYYKYLLEVYTYSELKQRVIEEVHSVQAITKSRTPARAYCCLYKLLTMNPGLNEPDLKDMITNNNGVVKGLGFLFIRIMIPSKRLWYWFKNSFHDAAPIPISSEESIPASRFVKKLLRENKFQGQTLPTIPIPVHRAYRKKLLLMDLLEKNNRKYERFLKVGTEVLAQYQERLEDTEFYPAVIEEFLEDSGNYLVSFSEYNEEQEVALGQIKLPREVKRKFRQRRWRERSPSSRDRKRRKRERHRRSRSRSPRHRSRSRSRHRFSSSRSRSRDSSKSPDLEAMIREEDRRLQSVVYGQSPAQKIMGYKKSLSVTIVDSGSRPSHYGTQTNEGGGRPPPISHAASYEIRKRRMEKEKQKVSEAEAVKAPSKDHLKKMQQLMAIYGDASAQKKS